MAQLEHTNITVSDAKGLADTLCTLFDWHIRWEGSALGGLGYTVHVGTDAGYLALYAAKTPGTPVSRDFVSPGSLNHIGVVVDDLSEAEARVRAAGFPTHSHADYEPGQRFYFDGPDGIEFEVVSYA